MNFFLLFMVGSFLCGLALPHVPLRRMAWVFAAASVFMAVGYFYFNRI